MSKTLDSGRCMDSKSLRTFSSFVNSLTSPFWTLVFLSVRWGCMVLSSWGCGTYVYQNHGEWRGLLETTPDLQIWDSSLFPLLVSSLLRIPPHPPSKPLTLTRVSRIPIPQVCGPEQRQRTTESRVSSAGPNLFMYFSLAPRSGYAGRGQQAGGTCYPPFRQLFE